MSRYPRCSLMGLPAELRIAIFEFANANEQITLRHHNHQDSRSKRHAPTKWNGTALLAINSQTRREAHPVYLDTVTFVISHDFTEQDLRRWTETIGCENIRKLRTLVFHCVGQCSMYGLQPDTDYCHRSASLTRGTSGQISDTFQLCDVDMCSNRAFGCLEMGRAALDDVANDMISCPSCREEPRPSVRDLLDLFAVMTGDQSSSAA